MSDAGPPPPTPPRHDAGPTVDLPPPEDPPVHELDDEEPEPEGG